MRRLQLNQPQQSKRTLVEGRSWQLQLIARRSALSGGCLKSRIRWMAREQRPAMRAKKDNCSEKTENGLGFWAAIPPTSSNPENSHLPFRRRECAMLRFRRMRSLQKFVAVHASVHNHFNQERHLYSRDVFKLNCAAALAEWRQLGMA